MQNTIRYSVISCRAHISTGFVWVLNGERKAIVKGNTRESDCLGWCVWGGFCMQVLDGGWGYWLAATSCAKLQLSVLISPSYLYSFMHGATAEHEWCAKQNIFSSQYSPLTVAISSVSKVVVPFAHSLQYCEKEHFEILNLSSLCVGFQTKRGTLLFGDF